MTINIGIIGFGNVGRGFCEILLRNRKWLLEHHDLDCRVVAIADRSMGSVYDPQGLELEELIHLKKGDRGFTRMRTDRDVFDLISDPATDLWCELTHTDLQHAFPAADHIRHAIRNSKHVITTNKGPAYLQYRELKEMARQQSVEFHIEGTVMAGTPVINLLNGPLAGCRVTRVTGILNGTTNYILTEMEKGLSYEEALLSAQRLGYAEADPSGDVEGFDALAKVKILSNLMLNQELDPASIERQGIGNVQRSDINRARRENKRWKLIGCIEVVDGAVRAWVRPEMLELSHPLASVGGNMNALTFSTDLLGDVTIIGPGAGRHETGFAILNGLIEIKRTCPAGQVLTT